MNKLIDEFNLTLDEFVSKLINQFPEEEKLIKYYQIYKLTKLYDKSLPIKIFMSSTLNNKEQIKNRDDNYFINDEKCINFRKTVTESSSFSTETGLIDKWNGLSDISKTAIWDYTQTLFVMGEMYINKIPTAMDQINLVRENFTKNEVNNIYNNKKISNSLINSLNSN
jgi:hypothetical protein